MKTLLKSITASLFFCVAVSSAIAQTTWTTTAGNTLSGSLPTGPNEWLGSANSADLVFKTGASERFRVSTTATNTSPMFSIKSASITSAQEHILNMTVSDAPNDFIRVMNGTGGNANFYPVIVGYKASSSVYCPALGMTGSVPTAMDYSASAFDPGPGIISFNARRDYNGSGSGSAIANRPLFTWSNYTTQYMTMLANGKVGIKTILPTADLTVNGNVLIGDPFNVCIPNTNYKLFVETGILTEKLKVAVNCATDWADYVFEESYKLKSIKDLEIFIKENKHLPNVPSATDVVRDGVDMATMDSKLLEKIEELSLYIIELKKQNEELEKRMSELEKK